uniref:Odorant receptor OR16 n=1 Tax=Colaphellus bowringi TaxID=561076 RepID=A0A0S3J3H0_9CUCU|nr:odorant receptor OR16 [Colaphellus bowringi]
MDIVVLTLISLTAIQFKLLNKGVAKIFKGITNLEQADVVIRERIQKYKNHHAFLMTFRNELNNLFSNAILAYMGVIITTQCTELYVLFSWNSIQEGIRAVLYASTMFFELYICYCLPAQDLIDEAEKLPISIYCSKWYQYPNHFKDVLLLLGQFQLNMLISAGGVAILDIQTGFAALKSMVSYFAFLRTVGASSEK